MESKSDLEWEAARKQNAAAMEKRLIETSRTLATRYPMEEGSTCLSMSDKEFLAHIRSRRSSFEEKYAGKSNDEITAAQDAERGIVNR